MRLLMSVITAMLAGSASVHATVSPDRLGGMPETGECLSGIAESAPAAASLGTGPMDAGGNLPLANPPLANAPVDVRIDGDTLQVRYDGEVFTVHLPAIQPMPPLSRGHGAVGRLVSGTGICG